MLKFLRIGTVVAFCFVYFISFNSAQSAPGDTIKVRTIEFGDPRTGWFKFPSSETRFEKIHMNYKLKCPCKEWDYIANVYVDEFYAPNFRVNGSVVDEYNYMLKATTSQIPVFQSKINHTSINREGTKNADGDDISAIGSGTDANNKVFDKTSSMNQAQYLWTAAELTAANVLPGLITGMQLDVATAGDAFNRVKIGFAHTSETELSTVDAIDNFSTVYDASLDFSTTGLHSVQFTNAFDWDGSSNIVVSISYLNEAAGGSTVLNSTAGSNGIIGEEFRNVISFNGTNSVISTHSTELGDGTDEFTIAMWMNTADRNNWDGIMTLGGSGNYSGLAFVNNGSDNFLPIFRVMNQNNIQSNLMHEDGKWYHIAAVWKSGEIQRIYINGELAADGDATAYSGAFTVDDRWYIGRDRGNNGRLFKGMMDDVQFWTKALDQQTIQEWMAKEIDNSHPNYNDLLFYYKFNDPADYKRVEDASGNNKNGNLSGDFDWSLGVNSYTASAERPNVLFEQGDYESETVKTFEIKTVDNLTEELMLFDNPDAPTEISEILYVYPAEYEVTFDENGIPTDSVLKTPDATMTLNKKKVYYSDRYTIRERLEIFRYITPYGNGLDLGSGFTWTIDVSDFVTLLKDSVYIYAPNSQEDLELTFDFIEGTPPRDIVNFRSMWTVNKQYNKNFEQWSPPMDITFGENEHMARLKVIQTGHAFEGDDNCNEFCEKGCMVFVDEVKIHEDTIWRDDCGMNPVYPQGGTWLLNRSNWCPGAEVRYYDWELTDYISSNSTHSINYDMEYYDEPITGTGYNIPEWKISTFLITYGNPNFANDAALEDIISPTTKDIHRRLNPICNNPVIVIKNTGSETLTSLDIEYGVRDGGSTEYTWQGELEFLDTAHVILPAFDWGNTESGIFEFNISNPNGKADEYEPNNHAVTYFANTPVYGKEVVLQLQTNNYANQQYHYYLLDQNKEIVYERPYGSFESNRLYKDTFQLDYGCYEFHLINYANFGLDFWFMRGQLGSGWCGMYSNGRNVVTFNPDFGWEIFHQFSVAPMPEASFSADTLDFDQVKLDEPKEMTFEIEPANKQGLEISKLFVLMGKTRGYEVVSSDPDIEQGPVRLYPGEKMTVTVRFAPTKLGESQTLLSVTTNDAAEPVKSITLMGRGVDEIGVDEYEEEISLSLQATKNPFSDETTIYFTAGNRAPVNAELTLFNALGQEIKLLHSGLTNHDYNEVNLNAADLSSGMYYLSLKSKNSVKTIPLFINK